jgi:hypothetical protein
VAQVLVRQRLGQGDGEVIACSCGAVGLVADGDTHICDPGDSSVFFQLSLGGPRYEDAVRVTDDRHVSDAG